MIKNLIKNLLPHTRLTSQEDLAQIMLDDGIDVNASDFDPYSTALQASREGDVDLVSLLNLYFGDALNEDGPAGLILPAINCNLGKIRNTVDKGIDVNIQDSGGVTALSKAAEYGKLDSVRCLLELGAVTSVKANNGDSPLSLARKNGHHSVVEALINAGATD